MRDNGKKHLIFSRRSVVLGGVNALLFTALSFRVFQLQVLQSGKYKKMSNKNRLRFFMIPPERGAILARDGSILANNKPFNRLSINDRGIHVIMSIISRLNQEVLGNKIELSEKQLRSIVNKTPSNSPIPIINNLSWEDLSRVEFFRYKLDKVIVDKALQRVYPYGSDCAHVLGYVASPSLEQLRNINIPNYRDFVMGKNGMERVFDGRLRGVPGVVEKEVNAKGKLIRVVSNKDSISGESFTISLDINLQKKVVENFKNKNGACVVLDVNTGGVLAMYSSPSFNPNHFVKGISQEDWSKLLSNPDKPLINKCINGVYPPGSTFKPITALAALQSGVDPNMVVHCNGAHKVGSHTFHCFKRSGHGDVNMRMALAQSCNVYFYKLAQEIGIDSISKVASKLGLGRITGVDLPFESSGSIPDRLWKQKFFRRGWKIGDTINASIGQGYVLSTPIQLATVMARMASGNNIIPSFRLGDYKFEPLDISLENLRVIREGLYMAINHVKGNNYNRRTKDGSFVLSGKTGTAQVASLKNSKGNSKLDEHGVFIGFAPYDNPKYAISCVVEHGVWGSVSALPIAKNIIEYLS